MGDTSPKTLFQWRRAVCETDLSASVRLVALVWSLWVVADEAHPGAAKTGRYCNLSPRVVRESYAKLVEAGWLELVSRGGLKGDRKQANSYRAVTPDGAPCVTGNAKSRVTRPPSTPHAESPRIGFVRTGKPPLPPVDDHWAKAQQAQEQQRERNRSRLLGRACLDCDGTNMVELDDGYTQCPTCNGVASA